MATALGEHCSKAQHKTLISPPDKLKISYQVLGKDGAPVIMLVNGLGGRLYSWEPLIERIADRYRMLTWDYRGLFESDAPSRIRRLAIRNHAEDLRSIMDKEKIEKADLVGWSMGVQVSLEFTSLYPERVNKLVLMNGTYGHAMSTGFQPVIPIPYFDRILHGLIDYFRNNPKAVKRLSRLFMNEKAVRSYGKLYAILRRNPKFPDMAWQYVCDVFGNDNFANYLHLFQELDAHSVYHHLQKIDQRTLIICGIFDILTPAFPSIEMSRKMKNMERMVLPLGSHFVLLEYPDRIAKRIDRFLST